MLINPISLMFWVLLYIGVRDGDFGHRDAIVLGALWIIFALVVYLGHKSPWLFVVPTAFLTIYAGWVVLGPDAHLSDGTGL